MKQAVAVKSKVAVEHGIPIPEKKNAPGRSKYPWRELKIGDSFFCLITQTEGSATLQ